MVPALAATTAVGFWSDEVTDKSEIEKLISRQWGLLMRSNQFIEALVFTVSVRSMMVHQGDVEFLKDLDVLSRKSAEEYISSLDILENKNEHRENEHLCSFCGEPQKSENMVAGRSAKMCSTCVKIATKLLSDDKFDG